MTEEQHIRDLEEARDDFKQALADAERELRALKETNAAQEDELDDLRKELDDCEYAKDKLEGDLLDAKEELKQLHEGSEHYRLKLRQYLRGLCPLAQREALWEELLAWADA